MFGSPAALPCNRGANHRQDRERSSGAAWLRGRRRRCGARCAAFCLTRACIPRALSARGARHLDVERRLQGVDALLQVVARVDVLAVAEEGTFRLLTARLASTLEPRLAIDDELRLTVDLALRARLALARALARGLALALARGARRRAAALSGALRSAVGFALRLARTRCGVSTRAARALRAAVGVTRSVAARGAVERRRIHLALRLAVGLAGAGALDAGGRRALPVALCGELAGAGCLEAGGLALRRASALRDDLAARVRANIDVVARRETCVCVVRREKEDRGRNEREGRSEETMTKNHVKEPPEKGMRGFLVVGLAKGRIYADAAIRPWLRLARCIERALPPPLIPLKTCVAIQPSEAPDGRDGGRRRQLSRAVRKRVKSSHFEMRIVTTRGRE